MKADKCAKGPLSKGADLRSGSPFILWGTTVEHAKTPWDRAQCCVESGLQVLLEEKEDGQAGDQHVPAAGEDAVVQSDVPGAPVEESSSQCWARCLARWKESEFEKMQSTAQDVTTVPVMLSSRTYEQR